MKKQLQKKISAFIVVAMMFSASANAQIVYTDIVPDSSYTITGWTPHTYNLDLNGDGTTDFKIKAAKPHPIYMEGPFTCYVSMTPQGSNAFITSTLSTVKKLAPGDTISSSQAWQDTTWQYLKEYYQFNPWATPTNTGEWDNVVDGYMGLQLIQAGQTYYGWVRMDVTVSISSASMTIKDYAYNSIPNQPILAGQTVSTGVNENSFASSINLFPNPATNQLTIDNGKLKTDNVTIYDFTGKEVYIENYQTHNADTKISIDVSKIPAGIYAVQVQSADFIATKKLIVEK